MLNVVSIEGTFIHNKWIKFGITFNSIVDLSLNQNKLLIDSVQLVKYICDVVVPHGYMKPAPLSHQLLNLYLYEIGRLDG